MQDTRSSSKQCSWRRSEFSKGNVNGAVRMVFSRDTCDPGVAGCTLRMNRETVKNGFRGTEFGQDKTARESVSQETGG